MRYVANTLLVLLTVALSSPTTTGAKEESPPDPQTRPLPVGWSEIHVVEHPKTVVDQVAGRLGTSFERLTERHLSMNGFPMKLNIIKTKSAAAAKALHEKMAGLRGGAWFRTQDDRVLETATASVLAARRVWAWLDLTLGDTARWEVRARLGLVDKHDYTEANVVFNHFIAIEKAQDTQGAAQAIHEAVKDWTPGTAIDLLTEKRPWFEARYQLTPEPKSKKPGPLTTTFEFEAPPKDNGVAYAEFVATLDVRARYVPLAIEGDPGSTAATSFWPAEDPTLKGMAERLVEGAGTDRERVLALLRFVALDIRYSGPMGSRHGVKQVLDQRFGRCWDKSDVLVTMCRSIGIPARQVAGWVAAIESGHVWAEVRLRDEGWIPVDATAPWLGISQDYIPLYATDAGHMPIVYLGWPKVKPLP